MGAVARMAQRSGRMVPGIDGGKGAGPRFCLVTFLVLRCVVSLVLCVSDVQRLARQIQ